MSLYRTNVALSIKGDRVEMGSEVELSADEAAIFDPKDITLVSSIAAEEPEIETEPVTLDEMTSAQLKERAKELGLKASGSAADIRERITLHLSGDIDSDEPKEEITND